MHGKGVKRIQARGKCGEKWAWQIQKLRWRRKSAWRTARRWFSFRWDLAKLLEQIKQKTGLLLTVKGNKLVVAQDLLKSAQISAKQVSGVARALILQAIASPTAYQLSLVRKSEVLAGETDPSKNLVTLDFADIEGIEYKNLPPATFDASMIFFHELAHVYSGEKDRPDEVSGWQVPDPKYTGPGAVENLYVNRIREKLGLPPRTKYEAKWSHGRSWVEFVGGSAGVPNY